MTRNLSIAHVGFVEIIMQKSRFISVDDSIFFGWTQQHVWK